MEEKVIQIIERLTGFKDLKNNKDIDLIENEIIDSLAFIELVSSLEDEFEIEIQPTQIDPNTWRKLHSIVNLVNELKKYKKGMNQKTNKYV